MKSLHDMIRLNIPKCTHGVNMDQNELITNLRETQENCTHHQVSNEFVDYYYKYVDSFQLGNNDVRHYGYYPKGTPPHDKAVKWLRVFPSPTLIWQVANIIF